MGVLDGRTVVVTGALGVLGRAVSAAAEAAGARVARIDQQAAAQGGELVLDRVDLTDQAAVAAAMAKVAELCGGIDGLVNIAGGFVWTTLADGGPAAWRAMFDINVMTAVTATHAALPFLQRSGAGAVVNIGANAAARAAAGMGAYTAAKSGVARLTESLAEELAEAGVRVNAVLPSILDTPTNRRDMPNADPRAWVAPQAIADVVVFLLSDAAAAITGASLPVTRGQGDTASQVSR
jgi:NAD(P)-dependent dehydrogenase (short-subunit alcohol dehydrogenase family)